MHGFIGHPCDEFVNETNALGRPERVAVAVSIIFVERFVVVVLVPV